MSGQSSDQPFSIARGPGMFTRWLCGVVLLLLGLGLSIAVFEFGQAGIQYVMSPETARILREMTGRSYDFLGGYSDVTRALITLQIAPVLWLLCYHRRPSVWPKILLWSGFYTAFIILNAAAADVFSMFDGGESFGNPIAVALYLVAIPLPVFITYFSGKWAQMVMNRPIAADLKNSRVEVALRAPHANMWLLLQSDRIVQGGVGRKFGLANGAGPAMPWTDVHYAQLGTVGDGAHANPVLRVVGTGRQWLLPVDKEHSHSLLELLIARVTRAKANTTLTSRAVQEQDQPAAKREEAKDDIQAGSTALANANNGAFQAPWVVLVVAIACLTIALISFFPQLPNLVMTGKPSTENFWGGVVFGVVGLIAATTYNRYRRGVRFMQNHAGQELDGPVAEPTQAPAPDWQPLTPPVYPRQPASTASGTATDNSAR